MTTFFAPSAMLTPDRPVPAISEWCSRIELAQRPPGRARRPGTGASPPTLMIRTWPRCRRTRAADLDRVVVLVGGDPGAGRRVGAPIVRLRIQMLAPPPSISQIRVVERVVWKIVAPRPWKNRPLRLWTCSVPFTLVLPSRAKQMTAPLRLRSMNR